MTRIEDKIRDFAEKNNIICGICSAGRLAGICSEDIANVPFIAADFESRVNPRLTMPGAESIIVVGVGYEFNRPLANVVDGGIYGKFALGTDYHIRVKKAMRELAEYLLNYVSFEYKLLVDSHPLIEREFAKKAGIGWQGKNCMLVSEKFGSYFNIGLMLTSLPLEQDKGFEQSYSLCGDCDKCVKACIGGCLEPYRLDYTRCVSYLTQKKGRLTESERLSLKGFIYGCDICQRVCGFNAGFPAESVYINVEKVINATNREIRENYGSAAWIGKKTLSRNAGYIVEGKGE